MPQSRTQTTFAPPVMEARRWLEEAEFHADRPLINVSQAAPVDPPPLQMRQAMAEMIVEDAESHLYGPVLGLPALRARVASEWSAAYGGDISSAHVAITSGCNQAFAAAIATLCAEGDEVIVPVPYYFNHRMWLDMAGVKTVPLTAGEGLIPRAEDAAAIALIVDETYRDFDSRSGAPHALFQDTRWDDTLIQLYSFSKAYRLTGHRVGALISSPKRLAEVEKFLDTVTICPNQLGQRAALWGMENLGDWLAGERLEILDRRAAIEDHMPTLAAKGWQLEGVGAYFAYLKHPFALPSDVLAQRLVQDAAVLTLPGTMFMPDGGGTQHLRVAFANVDRSGIAQLFDRLAAFQP